MRILVGTTHEIRHLRIHLRSSPLYSYVGLWPLVATLSALFVLLTASDGRAAGLKGVKSGTATIADGASSVTATFSAVDMTKSFLVFSVALDSVNPVDAHISGQLTNTTTVTFARLGTVGAVSISWYVAEFTSGVSVQRGSFSSTTAHNDITLGTAVDLSQSFPIATFRGDGTSFGGNDFLQSSLTTTTNLALDLKASLAATA